MTEQTTPGAAKGRLAARANTRDDTVADVLEHALTDEPPVARALIVGPHGRPVYEQAASWAPSRAYWTRYVEDGHEPEAWPTDGPFDAALVRLPRGKEALSFAVHGACSVLEPGAAVYVVGANDEGAKSAARVLEPVLDDVCTLTTRRHCRVIRGTWNGSADAKLTLADWRQEIPHPLGLPGPWVTYPGVFANGGLDDGTQELLAAMPKIYKAKRVLDYGCGAGVVSSSLAHQSADVDIVAIDHDALAVLATRENVPEAQVVLGAQLSDVGTRTFHRIVSNPPIHSGKAESFAVLTALIANAPRHLASRGELWVVCQRQVPVANLLRETFRDVTCACQTPRFHVWRAR